MTTTYASDNSVTVPRLLEVAADRFGHRTAIVDGAQRLSYAQLHRQVQTISAGLRALGLGPGDRLAIWMPNRIEWVLTFWAAAAAGAAIVPLNTALSPTEAEYQISQSGSSMLVVAEEFRGRYLGQEAVAIAAGFATQTTVLVVGDQIPDGALDWASLTSTIEPTGEPKSQVRVDPDDPVVILYTSGTTGRPKGAVHTHRFLPSLLSAADRMQLHENDCVVLYLPLFHVYALMAGLVLMTSAGAKIVLMPRFNSTESLRLIQDEGASIVYGVPTTYLDQLNDPHLDVTDLDGIRVSVTPFAYDLCQRVSTRFGFCINCFGMTETASMAFLPRIGDDPETAMRTVGPPLDGLQARIVDERTGQDLPAGTPGALMLRGPLIMREYYNKPEETARAFDDSGWFRTGDIAQLDAVGNLTFVGRSGDHFRVGGEIVDPVEVETALQTHPAVERAAVLGMPDERLGQVAYAWIQLHAGATATPEELSAHSAQRLARFKVPRTVVIIDRLPTTPSGKVRKYLLRDAAPAAPSGP